MPRPQQVSDEQIHAAIRACFLEHGLSAPVHLIARSLGVSPAALFQRVGDKEEMLRRAFDPGPLPVFEEISTGPRAGVPLGEQLASILGAAQAFLRQVIPGVLLLWAAKVSLEGSDGRVPPPVLLRRLLASWLVRASGERAMSEEEGAILAEMLLGAIEARCFNEHLGGSRYADGDDADLIRRLVAWVSPRLPALGGGAGGWGTTSLGDPPAGP